MQQPLSRPEGDITAAPPEESKTPHFDTSQQATGSDLEKSTTISDDAQPGVQAIEAAASVWTKWDLIAAYGM